MADIVNELKCEIDRLKKELILQRTSTNRLGLVLTAIQLYEMWIKFRTAVFHCWHLNRNNAIVGKSSGFSRELVFFSGGTAANDLAKALVSFTSRVSYILPVSDNGGSTSEILRVFGGPAIGDIRSRCVRIVNRQDAEGISSQILLHHRLDSTSIDFAFQEWNTFLLGSHPLYENIQSRKKQIIKRFLLHFNTALLASDPELLETTPFDFRNGSIGNYFLTGARLFFGSLESAIFLFNRIIGISLESQVYPVIDTNKLITIGVELHNGEMILGQNEISHPTNNSSHTNLGHGSIYVDKRREFDSLHSRIKRLFYVNEYFQEITPKVNPRVLAKLESNEPSAIIYAMGSFFTSILPCLILPGHAIALRNEPKIFILNGSYDRETEGWSASELIVHMCQAMNAVCSTDHAPNKFVTHLIYLKNTTIHLDLDKIRHFGIIPVCCAPESPAEGPTYSTEELIHYILGISNSLEILDD